MKKYFLHNGTEQQGPFDLEDLKTKSIKKDTSVWHEGLTDWTPADKIDELKTILTTSTPPPFNSEKTTPPPITKTNTQQESDAKKQKNRSSFSIWRTLQILAGLFLSGIVVLNIISYIERSNTTSSDTYEQKVMTIEEIERATPTNFLSATGKYKENFWGNKINIECVITNKATVASYKDAVVRVTYYSKTETALATKDLTVYELFPPSSTKTIELKVDNYEDVNSIGWELVDATAN